MDLNAKTILKSNVVFIIFLFIITFSISPANAKMYKWVDKEGVTHYTQHPPAKEDSTVMAESAAPATDKQHDKPPAPKIKKNNRLTKRNAKKAKQCSYVKRNLEMLERSLNIVRKRVKGKLVAMSEIERKQLIGQYRATISQHCQ